jgi:hypothetical protein
MHGIRPLAAVDLTAQRAGFFRDKGNSMTNRIDGATAVFARKMATQPIVWTCMATKAAKRLLTTAQHTMTITGLTAVALGALLYARPELAQKAVNFVHPQPAATIVAAPSPSELMAVPVAQQAAASASAASMQASTPGKQIAPLSVKQQKWVTEWLAKRYRVASDATDMLVSTAYVAARDVNIDPLLILAVMAIESGLNPFAESPMGAQGLMQVMSKVHKDRFQEMGGTKAALNPVANIKVGAQILKDYVSRTGSIEGGLKTYVGAGAFETDSGYGSRVMAEYRKLKQVASGKKVPTFTSPPAVVVDKAAPGPATPIAPAPAAAPEVVHTSSSLPAPENSLAGI